MTTGDVVYSLRFSLIKILPEPVFDLGSTAGEFSVLTVYIVYFDLYFVGLSIKDFTITVGNISDPLSTENDRCVHKCGHFGRGRIEVFHCLRRIRGRYVNIFIDHDEESYLRLTEIQVYKWDSKSLSQRHDTYRILPDNMDYGGWTL